MRYLRTCDICDFIAGAELASSFALSSSVLMYLSMYVCMQDLLVRLTCWQQQTKSSVLQDRLPINIVRSRPAHRQRDVSLLSGCYVMYLPPYCAGVTQYISPL